MTFEQIIHEVQAILLYKHKRDFPVVFYFCEYGMEACEKDKPTSISEVFNGVSVRRSDGCKLFIHQDNGEEAIIQGIVGFLIA